MDITYLNHSSFLIKTKLQGNKLIKILFDPFSDEIGIKFKPTEADVVLISHDHKDHNNLAGVKGIVKDSIGNETFGSRGEGPFIINHPGQYEVKGVHIKAIASFHDGKKGEERGPNVIYTISNEDVRICFLGDLGHKLTESQVEEIGDINTLMIPVGGTYTIGPEMASEVISQIEPHFVIPMHYKTKNHKSDSPLKGLEDFIKQMGADDIKPKDSFEVIESLEEETEVVLLNPQYN